MAILVTGGAGYIGSHMVWKLIDAGETVVVADRLSTGFDWAVAPSATLEVGDIGNIEFLDGLFEKHDIEASAIYKNNLLLVSSASLPGREVILDIPINEPEKFETHSTKIFFDRVRAQIKDINIEGMSAIAGLCFVFASRGHRKQPQNYLIATNTNFYRHQSDANIVPIKLNFKSPEIWVS